MRRILRYLHKVIIPSHRNNFRAKALHLDFLTGLLGVVTLFSAATGFLADAQVLGFAKDMRIERLYALTNEVRTSQGLPALKYNDNLALAAQNKAQHMFAHDYWAHFGAGKSPWDFITGAGYSYEVAGENLAKGFKDPESVLKGWENSPTHYANLVRPEYDEIGFAVSNGLLQGEEVTLVVQMFGAQIAEAKSPPTKEDTQVAQTEPPVERFKASGVITEKPVKATSQPVVASSFISLHDIRFNWSTIIIGFLLTVLVLDLYFAHKLDLVRLTSKNMAHIIFLVSLALGLLVIKSGLIL
jgi:Cysteine-rich secretory protein family